MQSICTTGFSSSNLSCLPALANFVMDVKTSFCSHCSFRRHYCFYMTDTLEKIWARISPNRNGCSNAKGSYEFCVFLYRLIVLLCRFLWLCVHIHVDVSMAKARMNFEILYGLIVLLCRFRWLCVHIHVDVSMAKARMNFEFLYRLIVLLCRFQWLCFHNHFLYLCFLQFWCNGNCITSNHTGHGHSPLTEALCLVKVQKDYYSFHHVCKILCEQENLILHHYCEMCWI